ncbi:MAG: hypothetical protein A2945_03460 [Candidatus Liptonbacteria bacterium RIFCSPLOWO2_01_FULL_52_25]|uniref:DUF2238 domain-containing protein n=1 Tax=Candidatus Liptonbacteria bacterium RIFCSPLOWO2_01_FULL_52_25 TaxID=1798650 RepID=A0A1G2CIZ5_9BACT|nr:MAG: hypothetical protein A2945_03460 [Candidatus Liptonbacteria bacterium RIFCSPLOWO2_01_FULL_52_25]
MRLLLIISFVLVAIFHVVGLQFDWYYTVPWLDIPMHMMGGAWVALFFWHVASLWSHSFLAEKKWLVVAAGLGVVAVVGIGWEIFELFMDVVVLRQYGLLNAPGQVHYDTLTDLTNDLVGAGVALWMLERRNTKRSLVE